MWVLFPFSTRSKQNNFAVTEDVQVYAQKSVVYYGQDSTEVTLDLIKFRFYKHENMHGNV